MTQPLHHNRNFSRQAMLFLVFGAGLLVTVYALWLNIATRAAAIDQDWNTSNALVHAQRIGKSAPAAVRGDPQALAQLEESHAQFSRDMHLLDGATPAGMDKVMEQLKAKAASTDQAAAAILKMKGEFPVLAKTLQQLDTLAPELLSMSEELLALKVQTGGTAREVALITRMTVLTQRMSLGANQFGSSSGVRPETVDQLGRDVTTFRAAIDSFLNGSEAKQVRAEEHPEARELLGKIKTRFGTYEQLLSSLLDKQPRHAAAKAAALSIYFDSDELSKQLTAVQSGFREQQDVRGARFWVVAAAGLISAAVAVAIVAITLQETPSQVRALTPPRILCLVSGIVILLAAAALLLSAGAKTASSEQARLFSDALMHTQRIGKAVPNAIEGNAEAFAQLEESRQFLNRDLSLLTQSPPVHSELARARNKWGATDNAAATILRMKPALTGYAKAFGRLRAQAPELLPMTEELLYRRLEKGAAPRELAAIGRMAMLTQRLEDNAGMLLASDTLRPEIAFQLGRDATIFRATVDGLLNGHDVMQLNPVDDPDMRALIGDIGSKFNKVNDLVLSGVDNLSKLTEAKGAEVELRFASEDVWRLLTAAQSGIRRRHDAPGIGFWILVLGTALVAAMAAATGAIMLREARTSARGWL